MADQYQRFARTFPGRIVVKRLGMPNPVPLRRCEPGQPVLAGPALLGAAPGGRLETRARGVLDSIGALVHDKPSEDDDARYAAVVFDTSGVARSEDLRAVYEFVHASITRIERSGRLLVLATPPEMADDARHAVAQRSLEGFVRSAAKELRGGATAQLV